MYGRSIQWKVPTHELKAKYAVKPWPKEILTQVEGGITPREAMCLAQVIAKEVENYIIVMGRRPPEDIIESSFKLISNAIGRGDHE